MTTGADQGRYAIYYAPEPDDPWWTFGTHWLGSDPASGARIPRLEIPGLTDSPWEQLTASARFYGFHGTLKPPFALAPGREETGLLEHAQRFAETRQEFALPGLSVQALGDFIALRPDRQTPEIATLAEDCVRAFDPWRMPMDAQELERRMDATLTARQRALLGEWGYSYVFDQFRFHLSLTGPLADEQRRSVAAALQETSAHLAGRDVPVTGICLYHQPTRNRPFRLRWRIRWGGHLETLGGG